MEIKAVKKGLQEEINEGDCGDLMADLTEDKGKVIELIEKQTGKRAAEIEELIKGKQEKFSGLLTENGAAFMVAKDLGVELDLEKNVSGEQSISGLEDGMQGVDLVVRVKHVFAPKKFEKNGKRGVKCNLIVADNSDEIMLTVWHKDVGKLEELGVERGKAIELRNCYVGSWKDRKQLNLGFNGSIALAEKTDKELPEFRVEQAELAGLKPDMENVSVVARVTRLFEEKEFNKEGRQGRLMNFGVVDKTKRVRATAWNDLVDYAKKLSPGELVKLEGAYTKAGLQGGVDLNLGWQSRIVSEPKGVELPPLSGLLGLEVKKKALNEVMEGSEMIEIKGKISEVFGGKLAYAVCPKCGKKAGNEEGKPSCPACGELEKTGINAVLAVELEDSTAKLRVVFFGKEAEKLMGWNNRELKKKLDGTQLDELMKELREGLVGKEFTVRGRAKENQMSGAVELIASEFVKA